MQEKICLKRTGNTGHFMESERNLYEYSNSFRHHTSGICTTGSECLRSGLSHHWIKLNRQYHIEPSKTFNSLPHTEVDGARHGITFTPHIISTHYLTQRQTSSLQLLISQQTNFNSLPHTEVDIFSTISKVCVFHISTHYLTQRQTNLCMMYSSLFKISTHYLTQRQTRKDFVFVVCECISTHYLTQRQTSFYTFSNIVDGISTHYLTQRQTDGKSYGA